MRLRVRPTDPPTNPAAEPTVAPTIVGIVADDTINTPVAYQEPGSSVYDAGLLIDFSYSVLAAANNDVSVADDATSARSPFAATVHSPNRMSDGVAAANVDPEPIAIFVIVIG
jgi:hypothetical protein